MSDYAIMGDWLVEAVKRCTCGAGSDLYGHEPGCGYEPIAKIEDLLKSRRAVLTGPPPMHGNGNEEVVAYWQGRFERVAELFNGGPDTSCRTRFEDGIECVTVPLDDIRAVLGA